MMNIAMIGTGYVGLTTGACFAHLGHRVVCVDCDEAKIAALQQGQVPIYEPGLEEIVQEKLLDRGLRFTQDLALAVQQSQLIFLAVPTPPLPNGSVDLSFVEEASQQIATVLRPEEGYKLIIDKSTVPVRTAAKVEQVMRRYAQSGVHVDLVSNPEFLREGSAVYDLLHPDRIVIGASNERSFALMRELYAPMAAPIVEVSLASAELIKHAANSFLAMKISYINAVAGVCEAVGADVEQVARGMGLDKRISSSFLQAGLGYGGSCFPKDVKGFIHVAEELGTPMNLLREVERINAAQVERFLTRIRSKLWVLRNKCIAVWGLAFKKDTDDVRESVALRIIKFLCEEGARVRAYDPAALSSAAKSLSAYPITYCADMYSCAQDADVLVIATDWDQFAQADLPVLRDLMRLPIIFDGRNLLQADQVIAAGLEYHSIGRKSLYPDGAQY